jgi:FtsP/CotA-like multicopper oxidase with cupredoxin domain
VTQFRVPTGSRVEFLLKAPSSRVEVAQLVTNNINTGPKGDCDPTRPIFNIALTQHDGGDERSEHDKAGDLTAWSTSQQRFGRLSSVPVSTTRVFQFSENDETNQFFITQVSAGQQPMVFDANQPPAVVTTQGSVERWIIQNLAQESHDFHLHQIHFKVLSQENFKINGTTRAPAIDGQFLDVIDLPPWDNVKNPNGPYPQVELLMDFRGVDIGDFVYHCHILNHEDLGMMAIVRVNPKP